MNFSEQSNEKTQILMRNGLSALIYKVFFSSKEMSIFRSGSFLLFCCFSVICLLSPIGVAFWLSICAIRKL